jgi:ATP-dependent protease HslVU (ClpYQ) peptidase subunit
MTCILGMTHGDKVYIGADSISVSGWDKNTIGDDKVFTMQTDWATSAPTQSLLIGVGGSPRIAQVLRYHVSLPASGSYSDLYLIREFVPRLRAALLEHGQLQTADGAQKMDAQMLVGLKGTLYHIGGDFQVQAFQECMVGVGVASDFAVGAATALRLYSPDMTPVTILRKAMEIAAERSSGISAPFHIKEV